MTGSSGFGALSVDFSEAALLSSSFGFVSSTCCSVSTFGGSSIFGRSSLVSTAVSGFGSFASTFESVVIFSILASLCTGSEAAALSSTSCSFSTSLVRHDSVAFSISTTLPSAISTSEHIFSVDLERACASAFDPTTSSNDLEIELSTSFTVVSTESIISPIALSVFCSTSNAALSLLASDFIALASCSALLCFV